MKINRILEKQNLTKTFETDLNIDKEVFIRILNEITQDGFYSPFLIMLDDIKPENKKYIGRIHSSTFKIRQRFVIDNNASNNFAIIASEFHTENNRLKIKTKIIGMQIFPFIMRLIIFGMYLVAMLLVIVVEIDTFPTQTDFDISSVISLILISIIVFVLTYGPYINAKVNVVEKKKDIDLFYKAIEKRE